MTDADRLSNIVDAPDPYLALEAHLGVVIGHKLFTLMVIDRQTEEAARIYSSNSEAYPVKGRKPLGGMTDWTAQVLTRGEPFIGQTAEDLQAVFPDHPTIAELGCASVLNLPVLDGSTVIGTVNLLHEAHWYRPEHAQKGLPYAALMVPYYKAWVASA